MDLAYVFWISYVALGIACTVAERVVPARRVRYGKALPLDLVAFAAYQFAMVPLATMATAPIAGYLPRLTPLIGVWLPLRVVAFYAVADLGSYWVHRWLHTRHLWRLHRWHHSPTQMYWLAGVRSTIPQQILFNLPFILASPLLIGLPPWVMPLVIIETVVRNDWMHMNVSWRSNWLERVLVTPRYHHLHHSADAELHNGNYGSLLTIWDRMFGTFIDPDLTVPKAFGTGEKQRDPVLLMIGI